jgi:hypothetical protein
MALDKAIKYGKEKRRPYRKSKAFDPSCRNHKSCPYCRGSRTRDVNKVIAEEKQSGRRD